MYAVIGAVFGEYVGAREGLGIWMQLSQNAFRTDLVFGAIVLTSAISLVLYWVVGLVRRATIRGRRGPVRSTSRISRSSRGRAERPSRRSPSAIIAANASWHRQRWSGGDGRTIVFFPEGAYGPTNNCVGIGQVLRERGHRVVFIVEESFAGSLEAKGSRSG